MNTVQVNNFIRISDIGSFSKAEEILNTTKTALKKQIDTLEFELGFSLFNRTSKGLQLTEAGKLFYNRIRPICHDLQSIIDECKKLSDNEKRDIKIGFYTITSMNNWYIEIETNSNFNIHQILSTGNTHEYNFRMLSDGVIDFLEYEDNEQLYRRGFCYTKIKEDYLCCVMNKNHKLAFKEVIHHEDLIGYSIYCWSSNSSATRWLVELETKYSLKLQKYPFSINGILKICNEGNIYILSHDTASVFRPLKVIPIEPKIPYFRGLIYKPENEKLLQEMLKAAPNK